MKVVIQRVSKASVKVNDTISSSIQNGLLILLGITNDDGLKDISWLCNKIVNLRIFNDEQGVMNKSLLDTNGNAIVVSQFTLMASTKKGNRPSYMNAAKSAISIPLYENFVQHLENDLGKKVGTGVFGADMKVSLVNDGPVTIILDSKQKE